MSEKIQIKATETGIVRVFAVDIPAGQIAAFTARNGSWPLSEALGAKTLDPAHIEVFDAADLTGVGLPGYLIEGHAISEDQIAPMRARLMAQEGTLMVVTSRAFEGTAQTISPRAPLNLLATFTEARDPITFGALPDASARTPEYEPTSEDAPQPKAPSNAAVLGRVATVVLLVLALLVTMMVWIAS
jgi:hypothetical protein